MGFILPVGIYGKVKGFGEGRLAIPKTEFIPSGRPLL